MTVDTDRPEVPHVDPQTEAIDHAVLEQLRVDLEDEDGSAVASVVSIYVDSSRALIPDLAAALRSGDTTAAARVAHALATPTIMVGARPLGTLLQRVQNGAAGAVIQPAELAALAEMIMSEADRAIATLVLSLNDLGSGRPSTN